MSNSGIQYVNQSLLSSVTSMAEVDSTSERGNTLIVLYLFLFDFLNNHGECVADEAFSFRMSIIELLGVLSCVLGDLPPLSASSFSAKSIIGRKFLSVSFTEMVLTWPPFAAPMTEDIVRTLTVRHPVNKSLVRRAILQVLISCACFSMTGNSAARGPYSG